MSHAGRHVFTIYRQALTIWRPVRCHAEVFAEYPGSIPQQAFINFNDLFKSKGTECNVDVDNNTSGSDRQINTAEFIPMSLGTWR